MRPTAITRLAISLTTAAWLTAGCGGSDCEEYCEVAKDCENANSELAGASCAEECSRAEELADTAGCDGLDDFLDCALDGDVCRAADECESEAMEVAFCIFAYCNDNPDEEACRGAVCTTQTSAGGTSCSVSRSCQGEPEVTLECTETECTCSEDQASVGTVPRDEAFCVGEHEAKIGAAAAACGWGS